MSNEIMEDFNLTRSNSNLSTPSSTTENKEPTPPSSKSSQSSQSSKSSKSSQSPIYLKSPVTHNESVLLVSSNDSNNSENTSSKQNLDTDKQQNLLEVSLSSVVTDTIEIQTISKETILDASVNTQNFETLFACFKDVTVGSKLWFETDDNGKNIISIDNGFDLLGIGNYFSIDFNFTPIRSTSRLLFGQNRDRTYDVLNKEFGNYMKFLTYILTLLDHDPKNKIIQNIGARNKDLIRNIVVQGLYEIKNTYKDFIKIPSLVDSIITTFTDFNEMYDKAISTNPRNFSSDTNQTRDRSGSF